MKTSVLIIDDHVLFSEGLNLILKGSGDFEVVGKVQDSRQAVYEYCRILPELVLIDYNMPYLSGLEVVIKLKNQLHQSKIVVISMYADSYDLNNFRKLGVNGYVTKTTPPEILISTLASIVNGEEIFLKSESKKVTSRIRKDDFKLKNKLTNREVDVLIELKTGKTTRAISESLGLSYYTVETHRKNINRKLDFATKKEFYDFLETL
jgi:DNA-binding NarL/FixJ family response regulator